MSMMESSTQVSFSGKMDFSEILQTIDATVFANEGRHLTAVEEDVLRGAWQGLTYPELAKTSSYSLNYLKQDIGPNLWKRLSRVFGEEVGKSNFRSVVERGVIKQQIPSSPLERNLTPDPVIETPCQQLNRMAARLDKICFEASEIVGEGKRANLLNAYVQMMGRYFDLFSRNISNIPKGRINIKGQQRQELMIQLLAQQLEHLRHSHPTTAASGEKPALYAVSYGDIHRWWQTALAEEFVYLNGELARYIHVERIFILQNAEAEENMRKVMNFHKLMGIDAVYSLISEEPTTQVSFLIYDHSFTNETFISECGDELDGYVSVNSRDISKNLKRFKAIKQLYADKLRKIEI